MLGGKSNATTVICLLDEAQKWKRVYFTTSKCTEGFWLSIQGFGKAGKRHVSDLLQLD